MITRNLANCAVQIVLGYCPVHIADVDQESMALLHECRHRTNEQACRRTSSLNGAITRHLGYCAIQILLGYCAVQNVLSYCAVHIALTLIKNQRRYSTNVVSELTNRASYPTASLQTYQLGQPLD
jgi:hypothetical protein